ncbi:MAG: PilW family protein [Zoogloeaceae bacterium]|jgi:type IV pilus assembly protein PilW|nr:PilW family protein [Zoogloeaceae bacterium]
MKTEHIFVPYGKQGRELGLSLVEIMIALTIGLIMLGAIFHVYLSGRSSYRLNEELARFQENGRVVMDMLERDLRMAAYSGCPSFNRVRAASTLNTVRENLRIGVYADQMPRTVIGTEAYSLRIVAPVLETGIAGDVLASAASASLAGESDNVRAGDYVVIHDCDEGELFSISAVAAAAAGGSMDLTLDRNPSRDFSSTLGRAFVLPNHGGSVGILYDIVDVTVPGGETVGALRRNGEELLTGVEAFRICLGQGNAYTAEYGKSELGDYVRAETISDDAERAKVIAVQVDLLLASSSAIALEKAEAQSFSLCGDRTDFTKTDRRLRKLFSTTVNLRNKLR